MKRRRKCRQGRAMGMKGQAAVTDSLYFLLIITGLSVFLFVFANSYGSTVSQSLQRKYETDFASSAMETLFNQSIPRDTNAKISDAMESDYLLAALKEDYADNGILDSTRDYLTKSIGAIMSPISDSRDYIFYFYDTTPPGNSQTGSFFYFLLKTSVIPCPQGTNCAKFSYCAPADFSSLQGLSLSLSGTSQSETRLIFVRPSDSPGGSATTVRASLIMWPATVLGQNVLAALNCAPVPA
ncbi:MAG: hypothetical protein WC602_03855 [archaeon]